MSGPRGKIPYVQFDKSSPTMGDSHLIARHLVQTGQAKVLSEQESVLTPAQKAQELGLRALLEDRLNWIIGKERWGENYYQMRDHERGPLGQMPYPVRFFLGQIVYSSNMKTLHGQGIGRYSNEEVVLMADEIFDTLEELVAANRPTGRGNRNLTHGPFWILDTTNPTEFDATLYGYIIAIMKSAANPRLQKSLASRQVLMDYATRIHQHYYPDYPSCLPS